MTVTVDFSHSLIVKIVIMKDILTHRDSHYPHSLDTWRQLRKVNVKLSLLRVDFSFISSHCSPLEVHTIYREGFLIPSCYNDDDDEDPTTTTTVAPANVFSLL